METTKKVSLWMVLLVVFLDWFGLAIVYPLFSAMIFHEHSTFIDAGASQTLRGWYLGLTLAAMPIAQFFSSPICGTLSDQKGRKPILIYSIFIGVIGYALSYIGIIANSLVILIISRIIVGVAAGNIAVVNAAISDLSNPKSKVKNFGVLSMVQGIGFTIGPFVGGYFSTSNFSIPFVIACILSIINLILMIPYFQETHFALKKAPIRFDTGIKQLKTSFRIPHMRAFFLVIFCIYFAWSFFYEFIPVTWIHLYQSDSEQIGFFYAYGAAIYALCAGLVIRPIVNRFNNLTVLRYSLFLLGICVLLLILEPSIEWVWVYLPILNFLAALMFPTSTTMVSDLAGDDAQGEMMGILASMSAAAFAISPLFAGLLLGISFHMPSIVGGLALLFGFAILQFSYRRKHT